MSAIIINVLMPQSPALLGRYNRVPALRYVALSAYIVEIPFYHLYKYKCPTIPINVIAEICY